MTPSGVVLKVRFTPSLLHEEIVEATKWLLFAAIFVRYGL